MLARTTTVILVVSTFAGFAVASPVAACGPPPEGFFVNFAEEFYMKGSAHSFWQEANGVPGLQSQEWTCNGTTTPSDQCLIWSAQTWVPTICSLPSLP